MSAESAVACHRSQSAAPSPVDYPHGEHREPLRVLRLTNTVGPQSSPYNQFSLALTARHNITVCNYFSTDVSPPKEIMLLEANGSLIQYLRLIKRTLTEQQYDIVHAHTPQAGILFLVACLLFRKRIDGTVYTVHTTYEHIKFRNRLLLIPVFMFFRRIVCCGQASIYSLPAFYKWLAADTLCAIPNGVDLERIADARERLTKRNRGEKFTIASVGRIIDIKDPLSLLQAFEQCHDTQSQLVFIGAGDMEGRLKLRTSDLGLGRHVILHGLIPREKVYEHLFHADVFVSTSLVEGLPVAVLEAMACGCPVILSDIPSHREIAQGADFIPLVATGDSEGFAHEITRIREMTSDERTRIGQKCRQLVEDRFSLQSMHDQYEAIYAQAGRSGRSRD